MRIPCPTASAGDSHINHRGGESKQLLWCVRRALSRAHITPQHVLACSEQGCISLPWSPRAAVSGSPGKPSPPTQELPFPALPVPQPCSDGEGMSLSPGATGGWLCPGPERRGRGALPCPDTTSPSQPGSAQGRVRARVLPLLLPAPEISFADAK